ncbi:MAG: PQQ-binding-like beta-propeller repeat protein [Hyphomonadaceae bacterium]
MTGFVRALLTGAVSLGLMSCQAAPPTVVEMPAAAPPAAPAVVAKVETPTPQQVAAIPVHPGETVYKTFCAACHDNPAGTRAPARDTLKEMSLQFLNFTLTEGKMKAQAAGLSAEQRGQVINYLIGAEVTSSDWADAMKCDAARLPVDLTGAATITNFGFDHNNTRSLTATQAGLTKAQLSKMELAWAVGIPKATSMRAQGAVVGKNIFVPVAEASAMYSFDISQPDKPCVQWVYNTPGGAPLRTSAAFGMVGDVPLLVFSGEDTTVHAVDARTGKAVWTKHVGTYSYSTTTGTPTVLRDRVIVPVAQFEIVFGGQNKVVCCNNHGYVLSLDPKTGEQQWRYDTMPDATPQRDRGDGQQLLGPSGAPIWNSPVVDEKRSLVYFATGESNSPPAHNNTDAVIAIDLKTGKQKWAFNATPSDIYNIGCDVNPDPKLLNCTKTPETVFRDVDFGASVILGTHKDGKQLVYAGQKSGSVWAFNPDTGKVVWRKALGTGGALGGVHWGIAFHNDTVFAPISNVGMPIKGEWEGDPTIKPGLYALNAKTGKIKWQFNPELPPGTPASPPGFPQHPIAMSTAPMVIDGVVIAATLDGTIYAVDEETGKQIWKMATAKDYITINGVPGKGGAIDAASLYAANGLLMSNSGYGSFGQKPGNVILAFKPAN